MTEPTLDDIRAAADRLAPVAHRTPVLTSSRIDDAVGASLFFKCENFQRAGAFKFRGAYNSVASLPDEVRAHGVVAFSSGNHAQALALAARLHGIPATIVMPVDAPAGKRAATEGYGATVVEYDRYTQDREAIARRVAESTGATVIPPFDHPPVMAGQGTAALELLEETGPLDLLFCPLGGGGLLSGTLVATHGISPGTSVFGVEPETGDDGLQSLAAGRIVTIETPRTIADGAQTPALGSHTFPVIARLAAGIVTATDDELISGVREFARTMKIVVEPTGALAFAAARREAAGSSLRVGVIVSGGNADPVRLAEYLA
ncbi:threo-3-hydroxy-L-aspartate ammonia-lyase [Tsukamurella sp. 8F]|uniref:threo-3-hydroxy-L-aspartate ammonia-lyase n=1 Tax=unclassified Tsukamurella TaxID=2633480 RepID=UPI0023B9F912|nr:MULTISPECIES: threo-3-hydroxy-L-aspartate ammonia-lyase [unclassified Tsukamurella]MDF0528491.1 threo-3-hydroxy-L-aspartate ammonia-lyase [Tsukamurella sp. 8J]MDF0586317.1 threo-3-hydroxy-L-aspartate ammonia-lyase [Tsukamurella sp. 8F]